MNRSRVAHVETVSDDLEFPEGPIALDDGSVLVVEIHRGTLTRIDTNGTADIVADLGGGPNGAAMGPDGFVYVCNNGGQGRTRYGSFQWVASMPTQYTGGAIQRVDLRSGMSETLWRQCDDDQLRAPNDLVFDSAGGMYFTDIGKSAGRSKDLGRVYYAHPESGEISKVVDGMLSPNGVGLSPDGSRLYVSDTYTARLWAWDVESPGVVRTDEPMGGSGGGTFVHAAGEYINYDSLGVEESGNICVASMMRPGISVIGPEGKLKEFVDIPGDPFITNITWGGDGGTTAYITASGTGRLLRTEWPRPGLGGPSFALRPGSP